MVGNRTLPKSFTLSPYVYQGKIETYTFHFVVDFDFTWDGDRDRGERYQAWALGLASGMKKRLLLLNNPDFSLLRPIGQHYPLPDQVMLRSGRNSIVACSFLRAVITDISYSFSAATDLAKQSAGMRANAKSRAAGLGSRRMWGWRWWPETGSNRRRRPFQGRALPLSYLASENIQGAASA
jgi:hypothetical protein